MARESVTLIRWLEILSTDRAGLEKAAHALGVHPLALEDCINRDQRAKLENYGNHQLLVWFMMANNEVYEIQFLIFQNELLMVPHEPPPTGDSWWNYLRLKEGSIDVWHLLYQAIDRATDITWSEIGKVFAEIDEFEQKMFEENCDPRSLLILKKQLNKMDYSVGHLPSVAEQLRNYHVSQDDLSWKFRDLQDHCIRTYHSLQLYRSQIGSSIELYWGHQANRTNSHVKKLSLLASIAVPLTFWASFWGMNFEAIPFRSPWLFYAAIGVMVASVIGTILLLVWKGYWED